MSKKMGYQIPLYVGAKGSSASTLLENCVDVTYDTAVETGSTTARGDGANVPIVTGEATSLKPSLTFKMIVDSTDSALVTLIGAARAGSAIALRYDTFDCDCIVSMRNAAPLNGEQAIDFTVEQVSASDRAPIL